MFGRGGGGISPCPPVPPSPCTSSPHLPLPPLRCKKWTKYAFSPWCLNSSWPALQLWTKATSPHSIGRAEILCCFGLCCCLFVCFSTRTHIVHLVLFHTYLDQLHAQTVPKHLSCPLKSCSTVLSSPAQLSSQILLSCPLKSCSAVLSSRAQLSSQVVLSCPLKSCSAVLSNPAQLSSQVLLSCPLKSCSAFLSSPVQLSCQVQLSCPLKSCSAVLSSPAQLSSQVVLSFPLESCSAVLSSPAQLSSQVLLSFSLRSCSAFLSTVDLVVLNLKRDGSKFCKLWVWEKSRLQKSGVAVWRGLATIDKTGTSELWYLFLYTTKDNFKKPKMMLDCSLS